MSYSKHFTNNKTQKYKKISDSALVNPCVATLLVFQIKYYPNMASCMVNGVCRDEAFFFRSDILFSSRQWACNRHSVHGRTKLYRTNWTVAHGELFYRCRVYYSTTVEWKELLPDSSLSHLDYESRCYDIGLFGTSIVFDFKKLLMALSDKEAVAQSEVDAFMENCAKR